MLVNKIFAMLMAGSSMLFAGEVDYNDLYLRAQTLKEKSLQYDEMDLNWQYQFMKDYVSLLDENKHNTIRLSCSEVGLSGGRGLSKKETKQINQIAEVLSGISENPLIEDGIPYFQDVIKAEKKKKRKSRFRRLLSTKY